MSETITLLIEKLEFYAIIGLLDKEREMPQKVEVWAKIAVKHQKNDKNDIVSYVDIADTIRRVMRIEKFFTVEEALLALCEEIAKISSKITKVKLKILKTEILENAVVGGQFKKKFKNS